MLPKEHEVYDVLWMKTLRSLEVRKTSLTSGYLTSTAQQSDIFHVQQCGMCKSLASLETHMCTHMWPRPPTDSQQGCQGDAEIQGKQPKADFGYLLTVTR